MTRAVLACLLAVVGIVAADAASARAAPVVGISDQRPDSWAQPGLRALGLRHARLVVAWDAAFSEPAAVQAWLDAVAAAGKEPHVAFQHLRTDRCPSRPCVTPTRAQYRAAVQAFIARFPQVRTYTTWNEANHRVQPVARNPEAVAAYYEELVAACPGCTVVAGDVLDSGAHVSWLRRFQGATVLQPQLWGLHNYGDVTYGGTDGTDAVLAAVPGQLWLEETGGIVTLRDSFGRTTLRSDEARASAAIARAFAIVRARPRITRMYVYHWQAWPLDRFDAGLVRPDGTARPSYGTLVQELLGGGAPPTSAAPAVPRLRWRPSWSKVKRNQLLLRATCRKRLPSCAGRMRVVLRTRRTARSGWAVTRLTTRSYRTTTRKRTVLVRVTVSKKLRTRVRGARRRRLSITVTATRPSRERQTSLIAVGPPSVR